MANVPPISASTLRGAVDLSSLVNPRPARPAGSQSSSLQATDANFTDTLDLSAVPAVKELSHLPVVVDPSQGTGKRSLVIAMTKAAVAVGADGLLIEVHPHPDKALKDGAQSLTCDNFAHLVADLKPIAQAVGRTL